MAMKLVCVVIVVVVVMVMEAAPGMQPYDPHVLKVTGGPVEQES